MFIRAQEKAWPDGVAWEELTDAAKEKAATAGRCVGCMWRRMKDRANSPLGDLEQDVAIEEIERRFGIV